MYIYPDNLERLIELANADPETTVVLHTESPPSARKSARPALADTYVTKYPRSAVAEFQRFLKTHSYEYIARHPEEYLCKATRAREELANYADGISPPSPGTPASTISLSSKKERAKYEPSSQRWFDTLVQAWARYRIRPGRVRCFHTGWPDSLRRDQWGRDLLSFCGITYVANPPLYPPAPGVRNDFVPPDSSEDPMERYEELPLPEPGTIYRSFEEFGAPS